MTEEDEAFSWVETESKLRQHLIHELTHKTDPVEDSGGVWPMRLSPCHSEIRRRVSRRS